MRRNSFLRRNTYQPPTNPNTVVVVNPIEGSDTTWTSSVVIPLLSPVYIFSSNTIRLARANATPMLPSIGLVATREGETYTVRQNSELEGFTGLVAGRTYYLGDDGSLWDPIANGNTWPTYIQSLGKAKNATTFLIEIGSPIPIQS